MTGSDNPFSQAIGDLFDLIENDLEFEWPYLHSIIYAIVILILLVLYSILYISIGVADQIFSQLWDAAKKSARNIETANNFAESSSHGVAVGIFVIMSLPFGVIILPFYVFGMIMSILFGNQS